MSLERPCHEDDVHELHLQRPDQLLEQPYQLFLILLQDLQDTSGPQHELTLSNQQGVQLQLEGPAVRLPDELVHRYSLLTLHHPGVNWREYHVLVNRLRFEQLFREVLDHVRHYNLGRLELQTVQNVEL